MTVIKLPLYWKVTCQKYPNIERLVRWYHSPPPSSAPSDWLFSTAKDVLGSTRPKNFESLLFLKSNLRTLRGQKRSPPDDFTPPNSCQLPPHVVDERFIDQDDDENSDIDISYDDDEAEVVEYWAPKRQYWILKLVTSLILFKSIFNYMLFHLVYHKFL